MVRRRPLLHVLIAGTVTAGCSTGPDRVATHLAFETQPATTYTQVPIPGPVRVAVLDENGERVTGSNARVTVVLGANPSGTTIVGLATVPAVNGVAEFATIRLPAAGAGFTLVASSPGLTGATSTAFNVVLPIPTTLAFQTQPGASVKDSAIAGGPIRVALLNENGDVFPEAYGVVQLAIGANPGGATLSGISAVPTEDGIATFSNLKLNAVGVGYTLVATLGAATPGTSNPFDVTLSLADTDGDGFSPNDADCDDTDPTAYPGPHDDFPDAMYIDKNCDGIDGDTTKAIFVVQSGANNAVCGTRAAPCRTIQFGLQQAAAAGKREIYLMEGGYNEHVTLVDGISIYGGFRGCEDPGCTPWWRAGGRSSQIDGTFVAENSDIGAGEPQIVTLYGANLTTPMTIMDLRVHAPLFQFTNFTTAAGRGRNSHAAILRNVPPGLLTLERVAFVANRAYAGVDGANGGNAIGTPALDGAIGGDGGTVSVACDDVSRGTSGAAGDTPLTGSRGGAGGLGGSRHTDCVAGNLTARSGDAGQNAETFQPGTFGTGGTFGPGAEAPCAPGPANGLPGRVINGAPGAAIGSVGFILPNDLWAGFDGNSGGLGVDGTGGGGGGGAGGCGSINAFGAGGGGGGAGGARASGPALGGRPGGGSFALYLINASPTILGADIIRAGGGGGGGVGGTGGRGQSGGFGAAGGGGPGGLAGGRGGDGAHGGHGAGGGGGAGGISAGIFLTSPASAPVLVSVVHSVGVGVDGGPGGAGGASAPSAPVGERDGRTGLAGPVGASFNVRMCAAPTGC